MNLNDLRCKCKFKSCDKTGPRKKMQRMLTAVNKFQKILGKKYPIKVNSGYRCEEHNAKVGGVSDSQHRAGLAVDITVQGLSMEALFLQAKKSGLFTGMGLYTTFIHLDKRCSVARWDRRFKARKELLVVDLW